MGLCEVVLGELGWGYVWWCGAVHNILTAGLQGEWWREVEECCGMVRGDGVVKYIVRSDAE